MTRIPFASLFLGIAGLLPPLYALALVFSDPATFPGLGRVTANPDGGVILLALWGAVILGFMGGCLWGFESAGDRNPSFLRLAATSIPVVIAVVSLLQPPTFACLWLAFGFVVLQGIDYVFRRAEIPPPYWLDLRYPLTAAMITCLLLGTVYG